MIWKILLTLAVIVGALFFVRHRNQRHLPVYRPDEGDGTAQAGTDTPVRRLIILLAVVIVLGGAIFLFIHFQSGSQVVQVRVINAGGDQATTYFARRNDIGKRQFRTIDGHLVTLADSDRLVISETPN